MKPTYDPSHHDTVVQAMASIFWGMGWADHVEEHKCDNLSGVEITSVMPSIPAEAYAMAERALGAIEHANGMSWPCLFAAAMKADGIEGELRTASNGYEYTSYDYRGELAERFGDCLAHMAMGSGVSWTDDHKESGLKVPLCAESVCFDMKLIADERCED